MASIKFEKKVNHLLQNVSRETFCKIEQYITYLYEWNARINLISRSMSLIELELHILDVMHIIPILNNFEENKIDLGSGSGLPGVVLSILGVKNLTLVDKNIKKIAYLRFLRSKLNLDIKIIHENFINLPKLNYKYIFSKAVSTPKNLITYVKHLISAETRIILNKNKSQQHELDELSRYWSFELQVYENLYNTNSEVWEIKYLKEK